MSDPHRAVLRRGRLAARRIPIGVRLTIRYTAAVTITVVSVAAFVYLQVVQRINREAQLLIDVRAHELAEQLSDDRDASLTQRLARISEQIERFVRSTEPDLGVAVEVVSSTGDVLLQAGPVRRGLPQVSRAVLERRSRQLMRAVNTGGPHALLALEVGIPDGALRVMMDSARFANNITYIREVFLWSLPVILALTATLGWLLARGSLRPISQILAAAQRISGTARQEQVPESGSGDELDQLARTLNGMLQRIRRSMLQMQRFNSNAAHQLRTPLTVISSQIELTLTKRRSAPEYEGVIRELLSQVREVSDGVSAILHLSQIEAGLPAEQRVPVMIRPVVEAVVEFFAPVACDKGVELRIAELPAVAVSGQAQWLHELFSNLVANAITHTPSEGHVEISGSVAGTMLVVEIADTGPGIPREAAARIFERFQRFESSGTGFGLGLSIAQEIANAHGGHIQLLDAATRGTRMAVALPYLASELRSAEPRSKTGPQLRTPAAEPAQREPTRAVPIRS